MFKATEKYVLFLVFRLKECEKYIKLLNLHSIICAMTILAFTIPFYSSFNQGNRINRDVNSITMSKFNLHSPFCQYSLAPRLTDALMRWHSATTRTCQVEKRKVEKKV